VTARRGRPGVPASPFGVTEVVRLRAALLRLYGADGEFMAALQTFAASPAREDRLAAYALAGQFGLDRIGPDLLAWADEDTSDDLKRAALWADHVGLNAVADFAAESQARTAPFPLTVGAGYVQPTIGERVAVEPVFDRHGSQVAVYEVWRPIVRVAFTDRWHPGHEARGVASKRILGRARAAIRAELDRLEVEAAAAGYRRADSTTNESRDLRWLFWKLRYGETWSKLSDRVSDAANDAVDADTIRTAVVRFAGRAEVRLSDT
jgi:hypothetical protein